MFCQSCLSRDRNMIDIVSVKSLILECKLSDVLHSGRICWECHAKIIRLTEFHRQIVLAQKTLKKKIQKNMKSLSRLSHHKCTVIKFIYEDEVIDEKNTDLVKKEDEYVQQDDDLEPKVIIKEEAELEIKHEPLEFNEGCQDDNYDNILIAFDSCRADNFKKKSFKHKCTKCKKRFQYFSRLQLHMKRHNKYICDTCGIKFYTKSLLIAHIEMHGSELVGKNKNYCTLCQKQLKNDKAFYHHINNNKRHMVINDKNFLQCPECDKTFTVQSSLTSHVRFYHLKVSKYKCDPCDRIFQSQYKLTNHNQVHHNEVRHRTHPCSYCGKKYYTAHDLHDHELLHSSDRSYMCTECGASYKQRSGLYNHARVVHGHKSGMS